MDIVMRKVADLIPYDRNTKKHDGTQVANVAESIRQYGFVQPVVIDKDGVIVIGHCRTLAAKKLKMKEVPCVCVDDLTPEQVRALRIVDNKSNESDWDMDFLADELQDLDLSGFELDLDDDLFNFEQKHEKSKQDTQFKVENILNLGLGQFCGSNPFDIPELSPVRSVPEIREWIGFNYVMSDEDPTGKAVHFFVDDYQFERLWNDPEKYVDKLKKYVCVTTPDFSPYGDMPLVAQMWNHYRKHWVGAFLQSRGVTVIPTIRASTDPRSLDWFLYGEPHGGVVCISNMWTGTKSDRDYFLTQEYARMFKELNPSKVFIYGNPMEELVGNIDYIPTFSKRRFTDG